MVPQKHLKNYLNIVKYTDEDFVDLQFQLSVNVLSMKYEFK